MSRDNRIMYMVDSDTGLVWSRLTGPDTDLKNNVAVPVLDWEGMKPENGYQTNYPLEKNPNNVLYGQHQLIYTRKIPVEVKNEHRKFWGMKPLKK